MDIQETTNGDVEIYEDGLLIASLVADGSLLDDIDDLPHILKYQAA